MADVHEHDLAAAYALNALDAAESESFEKHIATCEICRAELAELAPGMEHLASLLEAPAPPAMRSSVLDAIASTPQDGATAADGLSAYSTVAAEAPSRRVSSRKFNLRSLVAGLAVAAAFVGVVLFSGLLDSSPSVGDITSAPDRATIALSGEVGSAEFVYSDSLDAGVFITTSLPALSADQTYQLWLIDEGGPNPAGTFRPSDEGFVEFVVIGDIAPGKTLGLTVEPEGGSPAPTGDVLLAEVLG